MTGKPNSERAVRRTAAVTTEGRPLHVRWLGTVPYAEALDLQRAMFASRVADHLLLLEHPHVYTLGVRTDPANILVDPATVGAEMITADRGGDVTYHGPGQLVGYPVVDVAGRRGGGMADTVAYVTTVEQILIDALVELGLSEVGRLAGYPGVWVEPESESPRKIAAIGVRLTRGRSMHGFALNVNPDLTMFAHIVPCGITGLGVTSLAAEGVTVPMREVVDVVGEGWIRTWAGGRGERQEVVWRHREDDLSAFSRGEGPGDPVAPDAHQRTEAVRGPVPVRIGRARDGVGARLGGRLDQAGIEGGVAISSPKPPWMRVRAQMGSDYRALRSTLRDLDLVTVCEEAGCPNIYECWKDGTATFMINGERCTRACGFCLVDTRLPLPLDPLEPTRVADAVKRLGLDHAVVTAVTRDDLDDGGAEAFALTVRAIRRTTPGVTVEVLIPDCKGHPESLETIFAAGPDVLNHNLETVARLQRAVRPSAGYARSLAVLARASAAGLNTKSGLIVGMGETDREVLGAMTDLRAVGCRTLTIGQYLRPTSNHLPVHRWVPPETFAMFEEEGRRLGFDHVQASPLTRSSYHAAEAARHSASSAPVLRG